MNRLTHLDAIAQQQLHQIATNAVEVRHKVRQADNPYPGQRQLTQKSGHTNATMVKKHYGRWIPRDTKSMAHSVSKMMGF